MQNGDGTIRAEVSRLTKDVYYGNGKPGLCTRMEVAEGDIMSVQTEVSNYKVATEKRIDRTQAMFWAIILLLLTLLGTQWADMLKSDHRPQSIRSFND